MRWNSMIPGSNQSCSQIEGVQAPEEAIKQQMSLRDILASGE